jgi:hypothetical protein
MTRARDLSKLLGTNNNGVIDNTNITLDANEVPSLDTAKITTGTFASARIDNNSLSGITALPSGVGGTAWQSVQTTGFTAVAGRGYPCNTTSSAFTVTLPASATTGDTIVLVDYAGTFDTNALTINPNGNKLEGGTDNLFLTGEREGATLIYIDSTQGWLASSGINEGTDALSLPPYSIDFLVIAGGGGGGGENYSGGGGAGGYRTSTQSVNAGTVITVTVGDGGAAVGEYTKGNNGSDSSISGSGLTTITSTGGGGGGSDSPSVAAGAGGSGGGSTGYETSTSFRGLGNTPSTSPSQGNNGGVGGIYGGGGGGGAGGAGSAGASQSGGAGGSGTASSITGSSVTRAGGGGGGAYLSGSGGAGGSGGGGAGAITSGTATNGTANTGGGGGGAGGTANATGSSGGKGVVILRMPTANYSGTTTGSPTVTTDGSFKVLQFNGSGSYTT